MAIKTKTTQSLELTRVSRSLLLFLLVFASSIIIFNSGNLIVGEAVVNRWTLFSVLLVATIASWYIGAQKNLSLKQTATALLSALLIVFAGYMTYYERGMASNSTIFYILPLLVIATLKNRHALIATALLSAGTYAFSAVKYFNDFFNEGYRIQLWGNVVLYAGTILASTWLIMIVTGLRKDSK